MSLFKRLLNLWRWSALELPKELAPEETPVEAVKLLKKKNNQAQIVDPVDPLDRIEI